MSPEALAALHARCFKGAPRPWTATEFAEMLAAPGVILARQTGGFAIARLLPGEAELLTIAVDPSARRQGIGAALLRDCEAEVARRGAARMFLEVAEDNAAAQALYARAGYTSAGYRKDYYREGGRKVSALVLAKALPEPGP